MREEKGSALVTAILVVLVLTMVGLAAVLYMNVEQRIATTDDLSKVALYAAEAGLQRGALLYGGITSQATFTAMLSYTNSHNDAVTSLADLNGTTHLGTVISIDAAGNLNTTSGTGTPLVGQTVPNYTSKANFTVTYSLYVRNDANDYRTSDAGVFTNDHNSIVNLISVGTVTDPFGRILYQKILCEPLGFGSQVIEGYQYRLNAGGTATALK
jgi:hypothetical protein